MNHDDHQNHLRRAEHARGALAADLRELDETGTHLLQRGAAQLKGGALIALGAATLGGGIVGFAIGRTARRRLGDARASLGSELLGRAMGMFAAALASRLLAALTASRA